MCLVQHDGGGNWVGVHHNQYSAWNQANLTLEETSEGSHLKDDVVFALLIVISLHTVAMLNGLDNFPGLDAILNWKPLG